VAFPTNKPGGRNENIAAIDFFEPVCFLSSSYTRHTGAQTIIKTGYRIPINEPAND